MAKKDDAFSVDFWLHVVTDSVRRYVKQGGRVAIVEDGGNLVITLFDVVADDERVHEEFAELVVADMVAV